MPGDGGTPPGDGYTPPADGGGGAQPGDAAQTTPMDDGYTPSPDGGLAGAYDSGAENPGYNPDGMGPDGMPLRPRIKSVRERAIDAFRVGNDAEGFNLLRTHLAVSPSAQANVASKMAWIPVMRRPALGPRIGIAAHYTTVVGDFTGSPQPIGSPELKQALASVAQSARGGSSGGEVSNVGGGIGGDPNQAGSSTQAAEGQLAFYAGDFGTAFLTALKTKVEGGEYGAIFKDLAEEVARPAPTFDPNNPGGPNLAGGNPGDGYVDPGTGVPAADGMAPGPGRLATGITWLGKVDKKDSPAKLAQDAGVDVLVTYEIALSPAKVGNLIINKSRIRITDAKKNEVLFASTELDNRLVMQGREKGLSEEDPVQKQVERAVEALDKVCKPVELPPTVTAERVKTRIAALIAEKPADPLPVLLETRFYAAKGLLTESEMHAAAVSLLGEAEYAHLIASSSAGDMSNMAGGAIGLPGMIELMHGVNTVTGASARAKARKAQEAANPPGQQPRRGWGGLLPPGWTGR
jgi:hypothetical protein